MSHGDRRQSNEAPKLQVEPWSLEDDASERIGTIQDQYLHARLGTCFQTVDDGPNVGVDSRANILQIDHQDVELAEHLWRWLPTVAVQTIDRDAPTPVKAVRRLDHVRLLLPPNPVLR